MHRLRIGKNKWSIFRRRTSTDVWCPDVVGREIWDWGGQRSEGWLAPTPPGWGVYPNRCNSIIHGMKWLLLLLLLLLSSEKDENRLRR